MDRSTNNAGQPVLGWHRALEHWLGKLTGGIGGALLAIEDLSTLAPLTAAGMLLGHGFDIYSRHRADKALQGAPLDDSIQEQNCQPGSLASWKELGPMAKPFFQVLCAGLGRIAKLDGRITPGEIRHAEEVFRKLQLSPADRKQAIKWFDEGKKPDFDLNRRAAKLRSWLNAHKNNTSSPFDPRLIIVEQLIAMACLEAAAADKKWDDIFAIARSMQLEPPAANDKTSEGAEGSVTPEQTDPMLLTAFEILGISSDASDDDIKLAYRRRMQKNHPDRFATENRWEQEAAEEKVLEIQDAYRCIMQARLASL